MKILARHLLIGANGLLSLAAPAKAQEYPAKPIRMIVGFAAGGGNDNVLIYGNKTSAGSETVDVIGDLANDPAAPVTMPLDSRNWSRTCGRLK